MDSSGVNINSEAARMIDLSRNACRVLNQTVMSHLDSAPGAPSMGARMSGVRPSVRPRPAAVGGHALALQCRRNFISFLLFFLRRSV
jgi:hypothetical protein